MLKATNVEKVYSSNGVPVQALKGIDLEIGEGDYMVIAGPSGSGKTTLLNVLGTLDNPTEGRVEIKGEDVSKKSRKELAELRLRKLGFIFQAFNLIPVLTALENVEFPMMLLGVDKKQRHEKASRILADLGIEELKNKRPNQMSGGQQQRVAVARSIVNDPVIVLADEPTANLDSKTGRNLLEMMQKMNSEKNITFVFSSHDRQIIEQGKRLVYLKDGKITEEEVKDSKSY
ncbi:MAG: ABC transporter ATP-binding protein [Candidatus Kapaibacterium sp.]